MSSTLRVTNVSDVAGGTSTNLMSGLAKAWSNLNGTGTIAERDSFNVSGYVDNGIGDYTFTISSDMANANYSASSTPGANYGSGACHSTLNTTGGTAESAPAVGSQTLKVIEATLAYRDVKYVDWKVHGDLA